MNIPWTSFINDIWQEFWKTSPLDEFWKTIKYVYYISMYSGCTYVQFTVLYTVHTVQEMCVIGRTSHILFRAGILTTFSHILNILCRSFQYYSDSFMILFPVLLQLPGSEVHCKQFSGAFSDTVPTSSCRVGHPFFSKERSVLCILLRSL